MLKVKQRRYTHVRQAAGYAFLNNYVKLAFNERAPAILTKRLFIISFNIERGLDG
jgi:hypothetical protein